MKTLLFITRLLLVVFVFESCNTNEIEAKAKINERKLIAGGKLRITYSFETEGKLYKDSIEVNNTNIPNDSLKVVFSKENPNKHKLQIP